MSDIIIEAFLVEPIEEAVNTGTLSKIFNVMKEKILSLLEKLIKKIKAVKERIRNFMNRKRSKNIEQLLQKRDDAGHGQTEQELLDKMLIKMTQIFREDIAPKYHAGDNNGIFFPKFMDPKIMLENEHFIDLCIEAMDTILGGVKDINDIGNASNPNTLAKFRKDICHTFKIDDKSYSSVYVDGMGYTSVRDTNLIKFTDIVNTRLFKAVLKDKIASEFDIKTDLLNFDAEFDKYIDLAMKVAKLLKTKVAPNENTCNSVYKNTDAARDAVNSNQNFSDAYKSYFNEIYRAIHFVTCYMLNPYAEVLHMVSNNYDQVMHIYFDDGLDDDGDDETN